ncbi:carbon monoxide dehydrogenase subunit G [Rapidithrix thailandica]|uniref:Carbon monoxide dehydrogenase subunit G n=1 Tax=Rapidithrix thailandica TaxID=413964 RepID=A0AAW9S752_9BACT
MHLDGTHTLSAPLQLIWDLLQDPAILAKVTPGVKSLEATSPDQYDALLQIGIGPVKGSFKGTMQVKDKQAPQQFTLVIQQNSKIGNVHAEGTIALQSLTETETEVNFTGDAQLSGTMARVGQRVMSGVAKTLVNQFFKSLEKELENNPAS